jgi:NAD(P)-dependent dehydrogenase (short-subunit alcohol dehydrogenase family)
MRLEGRRILITGAASGIGRATARLFVREGASVALLDRNQEGLAQTVTELSEAADRVASKPVDVTDATRLAAAIAELGTALGGLDGVVNSAGFDLIRDFGEMSAAEWADVLAVNLTGPCLVCQAALPALKAAGSGTIVNIASAAALRPLGQRTAYCAAKAGLVMFGKALAMDLAPFNIRVNSVCPGIIDTPLFRASFEGAPNPEEELAKILDRYVIKRAGQPDDIAQAALYLSSDASAYVTGSSVAVDGGRTFH